jgi:hypothetical protein
LFQRQDIQQCLKVINKSKTQTANPNSIMNCPINIVTGKTVKVRMPKKQNKKLPLIIDGNDDGVKSLVIKKRKIKISLKDVAVEVVIANQVRTFWFPEELWAIIKSFLNFGKKYCSNLYHDGSGSLRMYCLPSVKIVENRALHYLKNAEGERVFHEDAFKMKIEKKWVCECCLKSLGKNGCTLASQNVFSDCVEEYRMTVLATEREEWYRERHPDDDYKKAIGAGKRHTTLLRKKYWTEWTMEKNLADLETYWGRFLLHKRKVMLNQCERLRKEIDSANEYHRGKNLGKQRKEEFIRELAADLSAGTLEYVAFSKLMRNALTFSESTFSHDDWRETIIRNANL